MRRLLLLIALVFGSAWLCAAQQTTFTPICAGTDDTAKFTSIIATIGANTGTIRLPYKTPAAGARCAVNTLTIPANIALDNTDGTGIKVNTGQTLTVNGPLAGPPKQFFYNVTAGLGTVSLLSRSITAFYPQWWGAKLDRVGTTGTNDRMAVQAAIDAAGAAGGGTVLISGQGLVGTTDASTYVLTIPRSVKLVGVGGAFSGLYMTTDTPTTTSLLAFSPSEFGHNEGLIIDDITLGVAGNKAGTAGNIGQWICDPCSGKHLIVFDSTPTPANAYVRDVVINRVRLLPTSMTPGTPAITVAGANFNGVPAKSKITNCRIYGGMTFPALGDGVIIENNTFAGLNALNITQVDGAGSLNISKNVMSNEGGIIIAGSAAFQSLNMVIADNFFEPAGATYPTFVGTPGSNGAWLDISSTTFRNSTIRNNVFSFVNTNLNGIRLVGGANTDLLVQRNSNYSTDATKYLLDLTATHAEARVIWDNNTFNGAVINLWNPTSSTNVKLVMQAHNVMPGDGAGNTGHIAQLANARFSQPTESVSLTLDHTSTTQIAQLVLEENGAQRGALNQIGSNYTDSTRRDNLELINTTGTGGITFWTNTVERARFNSGGDFNLIRRFTTDTIIVFADADTTPSVIFGNEFTASNTGATSITTFDDGLSTQTIHILFTNGNTTLVDGATLQLAGGANFVGTADDFIVLKKRGSVWHEISRSVN